MFQLSPPPEYIEERLSLYTKLKAEHDALQAQRAESDSKPIKVTLPDGKVVDGESWKTTPYQVAAGIRSVWDMFCFVFTVVFSSWLKLLQFKGSNVFFGINVVPHQTMSLWILPTAPAFLIISLFFMLNEVGYQLMQHCTHTNPRLVLVIRKEKSL